MGTNLISGIMAIVMMLTAVCGGLGQAKVEQPVTVEIGVGLDGEIPEGMISGTTPEMAAGIVQLINVLSVAFSADASASALTIKLADNPVASLGVKDSGETWQAVSDLFPGTVLTLTKEEADALTQQLLSSVVPAGTTTAQAGLTDLLAKFNVEALTPIIDAKTKELVAAFEEKFSEFEAGEYLVDEKTYTKKSVLNMTAKEAATLFITTVKDILAEESVAALIASFGGVIDTKSLEETLTNIANTPDEEAPDLSVAKYLDDAGDSCVAVVVSKKDQMDVTVTVADTAAGMGTFSLDFVTPQMSASVAGSVIPVENGIGLLLGVTLPIPGAEEPITFSLEISCTSDAPTVTVPADAEVIAMSEMQKSEELAQTFNSKIMVGMMTVLSNVMTATADMPEVQAIFTSLLSSMMPTTQTTTK